MAKRKKYRAKKPKKTVKKPKISSKVVFSDEWGAIIEEKRYRDTRPGHAGQYVSPANVKRYRKHKPQVETVQYRVVNGKRSEPVLKRSARQLMKTTIPGAVSLYDGRIDEMIRDTNIFTEIHKAGSALVNVRGYDANHHLRRFQFRIKKFGKHNQDQQLTWAIRNHLRDYGFRSEYNLKLVKMDGKTRNQANKLEELENMEIAVTLR